MPLDTQSLFNPSYLSNICTDYKNEEYFADWFFPIVEGPVEGKVAIKGRGAWFRNEAKKRAPGAPAVCINYTAGSTSYTTDEYAAKTFIPEYDRILMGTVGNNPANTVMLKTNHVANAIDLAKEYVVANAIVGAGTGWNGEANGEDVEGLWAAGAGNTFIVDVEAAITAMIKATGKRPNKMAMDFGTFAQLRQESTLKALMSNDSTRSVTAAFIAEYFYLQEVKVLTSVISTAKENSAGTDMTGQFLYEQRAGHGSAFLFHADPNPSLEFSGPGLQIRVRYPNGMLRKMKTWHDEETDNDYIQGAERVSIVQTGAYYGKLFKDTILT